MGRKSGVKVFKCPTGIDLIDPHAIIEDGFQPLMHVGFIIWEGLTVAVIVFGALAMFFLRRRVSGFSQDPPRKFWLRFSVLLFGLCLLAVIEATVLPQYGLFWFIVAVGLTCFIVVRIFPKVLSSSLRGSVEDHEITGE